MMRKSFIFIALAVLLAACSEEYDESLGLSPALSHYYLSLSSTSLSFSSSSGSKSLEITSQDTPWKLETSADWISFSSTGGTSDATVEVSVTENTEIGVSRSADVYFRSNASDWKYEDTLTVTQNGADAEIVFSKSDIIFTGAASSQTIAIISSNYGPWKATSYDSWLTVEISDTEMTVSVSANDGTDYRYGYYDLVCYNYDDLIGIREFSVSQAPADATVLTAITFENTESSAEVTINASEAWTAKSLNSWITVSPTSGEAGTATLKISATSNTYLQERDTFVNVYVGDSELMLIPVSQKGTYTETE